MSLLHSLNRATFGSSIGKKIIVAVTGLLMIGFLMGHLLGNLQIFLAPEWINSYGHHLQTFPLLWPIRLVLLAIIGLHIYVTILLIKENRAARGRNYEVLAKKRSTLAARTMALSGLTILAFIVYHIMHFTTKSIHPEYKDLTVQLHGETVPDVHSMMIEGFLQPENTAIYIIAMALLCTHLSHGFASVWQTFGLNSRKSELFWKYFGYIFAALIFIGYSSIPIGIMTGVVKRGETAIPIEKQDPASIPAIRDTPANQIDDQLAPVEHQN